MIHEDVDAERDVMCALPVIDWGTTFERALDDRHSDANGRSATFTPPKGKRWQQPPEGFAPAAVQAVIAAVTAAIERDQLPRLGPQPVRIALRRRARKERP